MGLRGREEENALALLGVDDDAEISGGGDGFQRPGPFQPSNAC